jgi:hypothetical protein
MRMFLAWSVGILAWAGLFFGVGSLCESIGLPTDIYSPTPIGYEIDGDYHESNSSPTSFGIAMVVFSFVVAIWIGRAVYYCRLNAGLSPTGKLTLVAWLLATIALLILGALVDLLIRSVHGAQTYYLQLALEALSATIVGLLSYRWWKRKSSALTTK